MEKPHRDTLIDEHQHSTVHYYETGKYGPYIEFFKKSHALVVSELLGVDEKAPVDEVSRAVLLVTTEATSNDQTHQGTKGMKGPT